MRRRDVLRAAVLAATAALVPWVLRDPISSPEPAQAPVCPRCLGTGRVETHYPVLTTQDLWARYVGPDDEMPSPPQFRYLVGWTPCPRCHPGAQAPYPAGEDILVGSLVGMDERGVIWLANTGTGRPPMGIALTDIREGEAGLVRIAGWCPARVS